MFFQLDENFVHRYAVVSKELFCKNVLNEYETKKSLNFLFEAFYAEKSLEDKSYALQVCGDYPLKQ